MWESTRLETAKALTRKRMAMLGVSAEWRDVYAGVKRKQELSEQELIEWARAIAMGKWLPKQ